MEGTVQAGRTERRRQWQEYVEGQRRSGVSVVAFCAANNLKAHQFWYWRRVLSQSSEEERAGFVEVIDDVHSSAITIVVGDAHIRVCDGFSSALLRQVIESLRRP